MHSSLSYSQLPIWVGQQRTPDSPLYNMAFAFLLDGTVDADRFRAAWRQTVERRADGTDARMGHHALILSDRAEVDAKPELEIYADDVSCAHGNTVGALDDEAIFYARQRGMPPEAARALLTTAFVAEAVERIEHEPARDAARAWVERRLEQASS